MELFYQSYSPGDRAFILNDDPPIIIIPGLFGSTVNWRSFAKKIAETQNVVVVDQRNHGESPHADSHTYMNMVADLLLLCDKLGFDRVVLCGHSMGGKVAMLFALLYPERIASLIVLDIAPVEYAHSHAPYLRALMDLDLSTLSSRSDAELALRETIDDTPTRLFLMQSLVGRKGEYRWRLNLPILLKDMSEITGFPFCSVDGLVSQTRTILILGGKSDYVSEEGRSQVINYFPKTNFVEIDRAGHWLHAECPEEVFEVLMEFLKK